MEYIIMNNISKLSENIIAAREGDNLIWCPIQNACPINCTCHRKAVPCGSGPISHESIELNRFSSFA